MKFGLHHYVSYNKSFKTRPHMATWIYLDKLFVKVHLPHEDTSFFYGVEAMF
jgi:hypothetical protein